MPNGRGMVLWWPIILPSPLRKRHVLLRGTKRKIRGKERGLLTPDL